MTETKKNTLVKAPQKPFTPVFQKPVFNKPFFNTKQKSFSTAFRTQSKGGGGK